MGTFKSEHVVKALFTGRRKNEEQAFGEEEKNDTDEDIEEADYREDLPKVPIYILAYRCAELDPDSHPPTNVFQKFMDLLHSFLQWTKTAEALVRLPFHHFL
jgi:hypothetical protein